MCMQNILVDIKKIIILIIFCLILSPLYPYKDTEAAFLGSYFGGRVTSMVPCSCNPDGGSQISVVGNSSSSGTYLYNTMTKTYSRHSVKPGSYLLGKYTPGGSCLVGAPPTCSALPITKGTINFTGTSL